MKKVVLVIVVVFSLVCTSCDPETVYGEVIVNQHEVVSDCCAEHGQLPSEPDDDEE